ncbi:hypothetical protein ACYTX9_09755, partial [Streptococcus pyogenes]
KWHITIKEVLPLINSSILNMINLSLIIGYVPQAFKVAVVKPLLKKPSLDPTVLANIGQSPTFLSYQKSLKD